jgi:hypothetical protein
LSAKSRQTTLENHYLDCSARKTEFAQQIGDIAIEDCVAASGESSTDFRFAELVRAKGQSKKRTLGCLSRQAFGVTSTMMVADLTLA